MGGGLGAALCGLKAERNSRRFRHWRGLAARCAGCQPWRTHTTPLSVQGLTLLECATGKYPYDASGGTIQLMIQVSARCGNVGGCSHAALLVNLK